MKNIKKIISCVLVGGLMITSFIGCKESKEQTQEQINLDEEVEILKQTNKEKEKKIKQYENYLSKNPITMQGKTISTESITDGISTKIEIGSDENESIFFSMQIGDAGVMSVYQKEKDNYLYIKRKNETENINQWYHTTASESSEIKQTTKALIESESFDDMFAYIVSCEYTETIKENDITYDILTVVDKIKQKENQKEEKIIYKIYVNTKTNEIDKITSLVNETETIIYITKLKELKLPEMKNLSEITEEEFTLNILNGIMGTFTTATDEYQKTIPEGVVTETGNDITTKE